MSLLQMPSRTSAGSLNSFQNLVRYFRPFVRYILIISRFSGITNYFKLDFILMGLQ